ncbi:serine hydrolase domain-containing protein [Zafaria sp. Z1313]|uniref:serine hydrolase domain-containing protein n=1 Tax=unclassified Zafaria TaxID=2828765 RepID=UPI002E764267|nr:serine hydrolase domain-containing protein [Zafaria sp. J156]MEE1622795.1 serine hydrolase domain-containing protein [Zafaria sp. J156]
MSDTTRPQATVDPRFESVAELLRSYAEEDPGYTAQLAVYHEGRPVLDLAVGPDADPAALTGVFSCSKGAAAIVMALLVQEGVLDLDAPVAAYWPEFAANGKEAVTVRLLLSHQAGLQGVDGGLTQEEYLDSRLGARILGAAAPRWRPGTAHAYHALSIGVFMEELARRTAEERLQDIYERRVRAPYGIDFHLGLPEELEPRYRDVLKPAQRPDPGFIDPYGHFGLAVNSTSGFDGPDGPSTDILDLPNVKAVRAAGIAAAGGVANARGLARLYAAAGTGIDDGTGAVSEPLLSEGVRTAFAEEQVFGPDRSHGLMGAFGIVFMKSQPRNDFGSWQAFGHDGANASLAFCDPAYGTAFGYVPARAEESGTGSRGGRLTVALRQALLAG